MNISTVIEETSSYLYAYNDIFKPETEIENFLRNLGDYFTYSRYLERPIEQFYRESFDWLYGAQKNLTVANLRKVLALLDEKICIEFCLHYANKIDNLDLFNKISHYYDDQFTPIKLNTRKKIVAILPHDVFGTKNIIPELSKVFQIPKSLYELEERTVETILEHLGLYNSSAMTFRRFLRLLANSDLRDESEKRILVAKINEVLEKDGVVLALDESKSYQYYTVKKQEYKPNKAPEYLIFGAIGTKPNIGISDALDGTVSVISDDGDPLTYDRKIIDHLNWSDMEDWWDEININPNLTLRKRLIDCLDSPPEQLFFKSYFSLFQAKLGEKLPALIPQVYIAYDPMRAKDLEGGKTRIRQRIDFLMILPNLKRVIIEIDGKQHYAKEDGRADTKRYAEMVKVDRDLRLRGYEVYRFGGAEFYNDQNTPEENAVSVVKDFFTGLFKQHEIL